MGAGVTEVQMEKLIVQRRSVSSNVVNIIKGHILTHVIIRTHSFGYSHAILQMMDISSPFIPLKLRSPSQKYTT